MLCLFIFINEWRTHYNLMTKISFGHHNFYYRLVPPAQPRMHHDIVT